jgi:hypothetical protein
MTVTATIDVSSPTGRRLVRELEKHKRVVKIDNPLPIGADGLPEKTYSVDEVFDKLRKKLEAHYNVDFDKI